MTLSGRRRRATHLSEFLSLLSPLSALPDSTYGVCRRARSLDGKRREAGHAGLESNAFLVVLTTPPSDTPSCSGRLIATDFLKLPNRRLYPDYYEVIKAPIALDDIEVRFPSPLPLPLVVRDES